jgi:iron complex outermembrane receptor protein
VILSFLLLNYNDLDLGILKTEWEQTSSKKHWTSRQGVFNHLLSLNSIFYFNDSKLDVNLGYIANDRSEFEDSDVAGLQYEIKLLIMMQNTIY